MSEPAPELEAEDALHGIVNQLVVNGERISVIIPGSIIESLGLFATLLTRAQEAGYLLSLLPIAMPWAQYLPEADLPALASDLIAAAASETHAPERLAAVMREWRATAEVHADPAEADRLRQALREANEGKATPWEYDETYDEGST